MSSSPTFADVLAAARRLEGVTLRTPLLENERVNSRLGGRLFIKAECLQRTGTRRDARDRADPADSRGQSQPKSRTILAPTPPPYM